MPHSYSTTKRVNSVLFPGVVAVLKKMTEGRRLELRKTIGDANRRIRDILREQNAIEKTPEETRDMPKWLELQDEFDNIVISEINPAWIIWGVKQVEGLEVDGKSLSVDDWKEWPSALFDEILEAVKSEAELNGAERKNSDSPTTSGEPAAFNPSLMIVKDADAEVGGEQGTAPSTSQPA